MPIYQRPSRATAFGEQLAAQREADRRLGLRETRQLLTVDRGVTANVPAPGEGQLMVEGTRLRHYAQGEWRGGKVVLHIKVVSDLIPASTEVFGFIADEDMDGLSLTSAHAYVTQVAAGVVSPPADPIEVGVYRLTPSAAYLCSNIVIDADEWSSYTSATPADPDPDYALVEVGYQLGLEVADAGAGDAYGLGVILEFS